MPERAQADKGATAYMQDTQAAEPIACKKIASAKKLFIGRHVLEAAQTDFMLRPWAASQKSDRCSGTFSLFGPLAAVEFVAKKLFIGRRVPRRQVFSFA